MLKKRLNYLSTFLKVVLQKPSVVAHAWNPSPEKTEEGGS
jgi:hypothetical protein